ncbi:MAG TPA: pitrilysin family protein [Polyangia bacterium]
MHRHQLSNGLTVVTCPDPHALTLAYMTWFAVGSRDEEPGHTGLAHLFEHLMFTQTKSQKDGAFDAAIESAGGNSNAHTSQDATAYIDVVPPAALPTVIALEADRMVNLDLRARQVTTEKDVVLEEWASVLLDDVDGRIEEQLWRNAFASHPYGRSVLGEKADLEAVTPDKALAFYRRNYGPRRAVIVVVGPFDEAATLDLIADTYGGLPDLPETARAPLPADERLAVVRQATLTAPLQAPRVAVGLSAPGFADADRVAFEILAEVVAGGRSSRLGDSMVVKSGQAATLDSDVAPTTGAGLWTLAAQLHRGKSAADATATIAAALERARTEPFTTSEVAAAQNRWESALWQSVRGAEGKAEALGACEVIGGDAGLFEQRVTAARALGAADLQAVAARQITRDARIDLTVVPGDGTNETNLPSSEHRSASSGGKSRKRAP